MYHSRLTSACSARGDGKVQSSHLKNEAASLEHSQKAAKISKTFLKLSTLCESACDEGVLNAST